MKNIFAIDNLTENRCFLCGEELVTANRTDEHVFPQWLLDRAGLRHQKLVLLNGTSIPYRQLKIPCCAECNNGRLSELEVEVGDAFKQGYEAVNSLPMIRLFQWCGKIWYGLLFKELRLRADRKDAAIGTIVKPKALEEFSTHHIFLQSIRLPIHFAGFEPASVFIMKTHRYDESAINFDFFDHVLVKSSGEFTKAPFLAIRCDGVGVVCVFEDLGATKQCIGGGLGYSDGQVLHPVQFAEVGAKIAYQHSLRAFSTHYTTTRIGMTDEYRTVVDDWPAIRWKRENVEDYKKLFKRLVERLVDCTGMFDMPGLVPSFLTKDGKPIILDRDMNAIK